MRRSPPRLAPVCRWVRSWSRRLAADPKLQRRANDRQHEYDKRERGGKPHVPPLKPLVEHVEYEARRRVKRPSLGHHIRFDEELEVADHRRDADEEERRRERWQRHVPESLPCPCPVDEGRVILEAYSEEMRKSGANYQEMFRKVKSELVRKYKAVL